MLFRSTGMGRALAICPSQPTSTAAGVSNDRTTQTQRQATAINLVSSPYHIACTPTFNIPHISHFEQCCTVSSRRLHRLEDCQLLQLLRTAGSRVACWRQPAGCWSWSFEQVFHTITTEPQSCPTILLVLYDSLSTAHVPLVNICKRVAAI